MRRNKLKIYQSRMHLAATILTVVFPFLFLLFFSSVTEVTAATLFLNVFASAWRLLIAYLIAACLAWIMAVSFYRGRRAIIALPIFDVLQSFPTFAALPIAVFFWGRSNFTVVLFLVITIIWPIFFSVFSSLRLMKHEWQEVVSIAGLRGTAYIRTFLFPVSVPGLITGSVVGLGEGWEALVATEIIVNMQTGLGNFFQSYQTNPMITTFGILGFLTVIFSVNKLVWLPLLEWSHSTIEE